MLKNKTWIGRLKIKTKTHGLKQSSKILKVKMLFLLIKKQFAKEIKKYAIRYSRYNNFSDNRIYCS